MASVQHDRYINDFPDHHIPITETPLRKFSILALKRPLLLLFSVFPLSLRSFLPIHFFKE